MGYESHEELLKVLHELHAAMKTSQMYQLEQRQADTKLRYVEAQRQKLESSIAREKLEKSKKFKLIEKEIAKRQAKYNDAHLKALKARNEYVLCMDAANSAVHKYFIDDLSDIIDVIDSKHLSFLSLVRRLIIIFSSTRPLIDFRLATVYGHWLPQLRGPGAASSRFGRREHSSLAPSTFV